MFIYLFIHHMLRESPFYTGYCFSGEKDKHASILMEHIFQGKDLGQTEKQTVQWMGGIQTEVMQ